MTDTKLEASPPAEGGGVLYPLLGFCDPAKSLHDKWARGCPPSACKHAGSYEVLLLSTDRGEECPSLKVKGRGAERLDSSFHDSSSKANKFVCSVVLIHRLNIVRLKDIAYHKGRIAVPKKLSEHITTLSKAGKDDYLKRLLDEASGT
ncbi:hypothetical protein [Pseudomonas fluorescens]|uniref:hypothetical protein n=1 Tax=Pseudomonas fluorescens TaxID=294 RepID=UPI001269C7F5|nr:hypothetical protein [Pseudomonas fluorescens]